MSALREILYLKWEYVDIERGLLFLPDSKTGKKSIVLNAPALQVIASLPRAGCYIIAAAHPDKPRADLKRPWELISAHAGLQGYAFMIFGIPMPASVLAQASVFQSLAHLQSSTTARYAHLDNDPVCRPQSTQLHRCVDGRCTAREREDQSISAAAMNT